jgi:Glycosyl transferase family 11
VIVVEIKGGLGNQLFQYAYGRALAQRDGNYLVLSRKWYRCGDRDYELDHYPIESRPFSWWRRRCVKAGKVHYHEGYWQSENYFRDCESLIRRELQPKVAVSGCEPMRRCESVSLHVRRGDYVQHETRAAIHGVNLEHYYKRAVALMQERLKNPHFFIFSNEPEWVRKNMRLDAPMTVMDMGAPHEDLFRMSNCRHHIMANSSFSWWGAWLNPSDEKIVTAPDQWFKAPGYDTSDLIPEGWIKVACSGEEPE